jgi:hypothetical protein
MRQALEVAAVATAETWEQAAGAAGEGRESIGGVDETCLERMMLVLQDLATGSLVLEDMAADRPFAPWKAAVTARRKGLGAEDCSRVSDRAQALIQLTEPGLECLRMPAFLHGVPDLVTSYALPLGQRLRHAPQNRLQAQEAMARRQGPPQGDEPAPQAPAWGATRQAEVPRWDEAPHT